MGSVYVAHDSVLDRPVAVKFHNPHPLLPDPCREAQAGARVHHPGVCPIFDYGQYCEVTTWSGTNCEGSSVDLYTDVESGCVPNLPFGSVSVSCDGPCYVGYASS